MFAWRELNVKILFYMSVLLIIALAFSANVMAANNRDLQMNNSTISARDFWSSAEEVDIYVDSIRARMVSQEANEQALRSVEQYRELLQNSLLTGESISNTQMEFTTVNTLEELSDELAARGVSIGSLEIDVEKKFKDFMDSRKSIPPDYLNDSE